MLERRIMPSNRVFAAIRVGLSCVIGLSCGVSAAHAQADTFTAEAAVASGGANAPLTVVVQRYTGDRDRKTLVDILKKGGMEAARAQLVKGRDLGSVRLGERQTAIKYVYSRKTLTGRQVTVVTAEPIAVAGAASPAAGFNLGLVLLDLDASGPGRGDLVPATKIRATDDGAFETEDYNGVVLHLTNVVAKGAKSR
jgi:hypothetical protein